MLYFRFVANAFVLGVVEVKLWEARRKVKGKGVLEDSKNCCAGLANSMEWRGDAAFRSCEFVAGALLVKRRKIEKHTRAFVLLRNVSSTRRTAAW
jgi:hypothetical protein